MRRLASPGAAAAASRGELSARDFALLRALVAERTGISLGPHKRALLQARLAPRLRALGIATFGEYGRACMSQDPAAEEPIRFVNAVTTTRTEFYREPQHFAYLADRWMPEVLARAARGAPRRLRIWSAGCSSGEEPYTIAMTVRDGLADASGWNVRILASDINTEVLRRAAAGIYSDEAVRPIPRPVLRRHFQRGRRASAGLVRVRSELRGLVAFRRINLIEEGWPIRARFDVIFCRNVLIYFDPPIQRRVIGRLSEHLGDGGLLVLGHSEGVRGLLSGLQHLGSAIYRKEDAHAGDHPRR